MKSKKGIVMRLLICIALCFGIVYGGTMAAVNAAFINSVTFSAENEMTDVEEISNNILETGEIL